MEGRVALPTVGAVVAGPGELFPWLVRDDAGQEIVPIGNYLRDLMLGDAS